MFKLSAWVLVITSALSGCGGMRLFGTDDELEAHLVDQNEFREPPGLRKVAIARSNALKRLLYEAAESRAEPIAVLKIVHTKEGDPVYHRLEVWPQKAVLTRDFSRDKLAPLLKRTRESKPVRVRRLGYLSREDRRFVPVPADSTEEVPAETELKVECELPDGEKTYF